MYKIENDKFYLPDEDLTSYYELRNGLEVYDKDFEVYGIVEDCEDPHNIIVEYENEGKGIYCLIDDCDLYDSNLIVKKIN